MTQRSNIILTGMPAVGKSTVGRILADTLFMAFMDTDEYITAREGRDLQAIIAEEGLDGFCRREEQHILSLRVTETVISTGGSVIYGSAAMDYLISLGRVVYLRADLDLLMHRIDDPVKRGVVRKPGQSFTSLLEERDVLYMRYADIVVDCPKDDTPHATAARVVSRL